MIGALITEISGVHQAAAGHGRLEADSGGGGRVRAVK